MTIYGIIMLILPGLLHIQGPTSLLVFFIMNSIINLLMSYSKEHMRILGSLIEDADIIDEHIEQGLSFEESQAIVIENFQYRNLKRWIPKGVSLSITISTIICMVGILSGLVKLIRQ